MAKNDIKNLLEEMRGVVASMKESYVFDDKEKDLYSQDELELGMEDDCMPKDDKVSQIRAMALEGIQEYAHDVDSEYYDFYKKVWMMCDKVCSNKEKSNSAE